MRGLLIGIILLTAVAMYGGPDSASACILGPVEPAPAPGMTSGPDCRWYFTDGETWFDHGQHMSRARFEWGAGGTDWLSTMDPIAGTLPFYVLIAAGFAVLAAWAGSDRRHASRP